MKPLQNQNKKKKERQIIDQFRHGFPEFPKGKLISSESPDFILRVSSKQAIGIELVSVLLPNESLKSIFLEIGNTILSKENKLPLYRKKKLDWYWLLLYTENPGQAAVLARKQISEMNVESPYHKIFFIYVPECAIAVIK